MRYGYARVSSRSQDYSAQADALKAADCERIFSEKRSGKSATDRPEFNKLMRTLVPGDIILLMSWRDHSTAEAFEAKVSLQDGARLRRVRVVRDYGMFDRREAPQYYPDITRSNTERP